MLTVTGLLLIAIAVGLLGWMGYEYFGTNAPSRDAARSEVSQLERQWNTTDGTQSQEPSASTSASVPAASASPASATTYSQAQLDKAMAILTIPRFGPDYKVPILVGTSDYALARGVGWYQSTQQPGQLGNFAIAGNRVTHGEPFARLLELQPGDKVVVETKSYIFTYQIDESPSKLTVKDVDTWVLDPVPGKTGVKPSQALITLTTCQDLFRSPDRSVGFGHLVQTTRK
ncbi:MAG: class E sortase [Actinobacteria bacterium]|nr:class E sortase [Actinomycetota bacterium]